MVPGTRNEHLAAGAGGDSLHTFVARSAAAFGNGPANVVEGTFSLAGFTVQAVGCVGRLDLTVNRLVDAGRAERYAGTVEKCCAS